MVWVFMYIVFLLGSRAYYVEAMATGIAQRVSDCPRDRKEWQKASNKLNCSSDVLSTKNKYHCLPADNLTTLVEFCYNRTRINVVKGLCMVFIERQNIVNHYDCSRFKDGCPNAWYFSNEMYKFPACLEIEPTQGCYSAEPSCQLASRTTKQQKPMIITALLDTTSSTMDNGIITTNTHDRGLESLVTIMPFILFIGLVAAIIAWRKKIQDEESSYLLKNENWEKIETNIDEFGIEYLLQELPREQKIFPMIAKKLGIPQEILYWKPANIANFVKCMKDGSISVYNARGMVIGCAGAGKTTLVKKLKGEKDLETYSTSGIEMHSHVFKLNADETTINACAKTEKRKGCLCLTPSTVENTTETPISKKTEVPYHWSEAMSLMQTVQTEFIEEPEVSVRSTEFQSKSNIPDNHEDKEFYLPFDRSTVSIRATPDNEKCNAKFDFSNCIASVNENNLKMLSLLDFAGHSAYYACHHIFFSPRAFFILVVDMTRPLGNVANESCVEKDLIYSNWTYADYIRYWLGSIHTYSSKEAPVILVASHAESNGADLHKAMDYFFEICKRLPKKLRKHMDKNRVFSVEKKSNKSMENLKKCITSTVKSQSQWGEKVPISWLKLESMLQKLRKDRKLYLFSDLLGNVKNMSELRIENEKDLIIALTFFHETGVILFRSEIKDIIILDVQWFIDAFKCIILDNEQMKSKNEFNFEDFNGLYRFGLLSTNLLNSLWKDNTFFQHKQSLVTHMKQLDIIAELSKDMWYVPCMNKQRYQCNILEDCNVSSILCFLYKFLPFVIYHRLVVACINNLGMKPLQIEGKPCIFHTVTILTYKDQTHRVLIGICDNRELTHTEFPYSIEIQTNVTKPEKINTQLTSKLKKDICQYLTDLTKAFWSSERSYDVGYRCMIQPFGGTNKSRILKEDEMLKSTYVCSKCSPCHTVDLTSLLSFWKVMLALRFFASGSFMEVIGDTIGFDKSTVSRAINNVTNALVLHRDIFIKWPNPAETAESKRNFFLRGGFPGVIGCVDGTNVRIQAPSEDEPVYVNRKGWHSVNVQANCDREDTIVLVSYRHSFSFLSIQ